MQRRHRHPYAAVTGNEALKTDRAREIQDDYDKKNQKRLETFSEIFPCFQRKRMYA